MENKREIKFRAFGKQSEKFHYFSLNDAQSRWVVPDEEIEEYQQFTGYLDKSGKEIYEGDILEAETFWAEIDWICDGWELSIYPKDGSKEHGGRLSTYVERYELEVIGNVFESKDLLLKIKTEKREKSC